MVFWVLTNAHHWWLNDRVKGQIFQTWYLRVDSVYLGIIIGGKLIQIRETGAIWGDSIRKFHLIIENIDVALSSRIVREVNYVDIMQSKHMPISSSLENRCGL